MNQNHAYKGRFWIPDENDKILYGHLKFKNGIGCLELFGSFDKEPNRVGSNPRRSLPVLSGYLETHIQCVFKVCTLKFTSQAIIFSYIEFDHFFYAHGDNTFADGISFSKIFIEQNLVIIKFK